MAAYTEAVLRVPVRKSGGGGFAEMERRWRGRVGMDWVLRDGCTSDGEGRGRGAGGAARLGGKWLTGRGLG